MIVITTASRVWSIKKQWWEFDPTLVLRQFDLCWSGLEHYEKTHSSVRQQIHWTPVVAKWYTSFETCSASSEIVYTLMKLESHCGGHKAFNQETSIQTISTLRLHHQHSFGRAYGGRKFGLFACSSMERKRTELTESSETVDTATAWQVWGA
jgi:hypothetical protein